MAPMEITTQNVVTRVANLPLVSSTYDMVSNVYCNTKDNHPYIKSIFDAAEMGVKSLTSVALTSALPIIGKLEPQISLANDLACKGLDKIEKTLPLLHQPSEQLVASAKEVVTGAKEAVSETMNGAKDTVSLTLSGVVGRTRGAVQESVVKTRLVVSGGVYTVMESRVGKLVSSGMDTALSTSESLVERYLPETEAKQECETNSTIGFDSDTDEPSYYVRLGSLSTKLRQRAYQKAVTKVHDAKKRSQESISQLNHAMDMIEYTKKNIDGANQKMHDKLSTLMDWRSRSPSTMESDSDPDSEAEQIESRTLAITRNLTQQLQTTCLTFVSSLQGLPQNIQEQAVSISHLAMEVYTRFSKTAALGDMSDTVLTTTRVQLNRMRDSIDNILDYLVNNTPLNWLVGPFYPRMEQSASSNTQSKKARDTKSQ
ncbi:perilipin-2 [Pygocentrus nattereri]|uniref:Perilipin n=1 Tax=Pygocentrus nattereri TaxID=42514 RepID=A0AAR2JBN9_PYGNA|nr:perilipin-2 [Pygocentrus nattereri]XP_037400810.1 perilipin-2 [Pygocentrus nattereri]